MIPGIPAATSAWLNKKRRHIMRCLASLSHARRTFASATAGVFGFLVTPTTGTPSTASTKSHRSTPFAISGHSAANDARSAPSGSNPIACSHRVMELSRRLTSGSEYGRASYPLTARPARGSTALNAVGGSEGLFVRFFAAFAGIGTYW